MHKPKIANRWVWGSSAVVAIFVLAAIWYGFDWVGGEVTLEVVPAIKQTALAPHKASYG